LLRVGIVGASGYTGLELLRLLLQHPEVKITVVTSEKYAGQRTSEVFPVLRDWVPLVYQKLCPEDITGECDLIFIALPHLSSMSIVPSFLKNNIRIIDLSADFRLKNPKIFIQWYGSIHACPEVLPEAVYGLPEIYRSKIKEARIVANPGCYPTSIILALAPLLKNDLLQDSFVIADAKSGISGAGRKMDLEYQFCEAHEATKVYQPTAHRHIPEMEQEVSSLAGREIQVSFTPHLVPMTRGILSTIYVRLKESCELQDIWEHYQHFYQNEPFIRVRPLGSLPNTHEVMGSNCCDIALFHDERSKIFKVVSIIDNLVKGASGQAIQNMNIMCAFSEKTGLDTLPLFP
jgi:N-acetyl-gamma-glutamyl-phosphate reductase